MSKKASFSGTKRSKSTIDVSDDEDDFIIFGGLEFESEDDQPQVLRTTLKKRKKQSHLEEFDDSYDEEVLIPRSPKHLQLDSAKTQARLFDKTQFSDFILRFPKSGATLSLHKAIVCPQSDFFNACLTSGMQEQAQGVIEAAADDDQALLSLLLRACYESSIAIPQDEAKHVDLLLLARKYQFLSIAQSLESDICRRMSTTSIVGVLSRTPRLLEIESVKKQVAAIVRMNWESVFATSGKYAKQIAQLSPESVLFLLESAQATQSTVQERRIPKLLRFVQEWIKHDQTNRQQHSFALIQKINGSGTSSKASKAAASTGMAVKKSKFQDEEFLEDDEFQFFAKSSFLSTHDIGAVAAKIMESVALHSSTPTQHRNMIGSATPKTRALVLQQSRLFDSQQFSDFVVRFPRSGKTLSLHKAIVCPCSSFFNACLTSGMQEQESALADEVGEHVKPHSVLRVLCMTPRILDIERKYLQNLDRDLFKFVFSAVCQSELALGERTPMLLEWLEIWIKHDAENRKQHAFEFVQLLNQAIKSHASSSSSTKPK